jgi:PAS domain S-box-containing protein
MGGKPTCEELEQRVKALEKESEKLKHSEKALRQSEKRFRLFSEASFEGIAITEKEVLIEANEQFAAMFGYELFEVVGMEALDFVAPESQNLVLQNMRKGFEEPYEFLALKNDGSTFEAEVHGKAISYKERTVRVAAIRDISKRKQAESALEESEEKYRKVVENVNVGMVVVQDLKFVFVNQTISTFLGYSQDEILSNPNPFQFVHPDDTEMVFERHMKRIENYDDVPDIYPFRVVTKDGDVKWVEVTAARINWEGKPAILNFFMDITERKLVAEKLEELNSIINRSPVVVFLWENETNWPVEFVSENVEEVFG